MAIETGPGFDFLEELPLGIHTLAEGSPSDTIKLALYGPNSTITRFLPTYTTAGEVSGGGYVAGGYTLTGFTMIGKAGSARNDGVQFEFAYLQPTEDFVAFVDNVAIRGCMVYNATQGNRNIFTLDFGQSIVPDVGIQLLWGKDNVVNANDVLIPMKGQTT